MRPCDVLASVWERDMIAVMLAACVKSVTVVKREEVSLSTNASLLLAGVYFTNCQCRCDPVERVHASCVAPISMKAWMRVPFSLLALLAMFATLVPETLWACPLTGRVDTAARVCALPMKSGRTPCAHTGGKCCTPLSVPASQTDNDSGRQHVFAAPDRSPLSLVLVAAGVVTPFVVPHVETFGAPTVRVYLARFANPPPLFWTWHRPLSVAGRAPPVVES